MYGDVCKTTHVCVEQYLENTIRQLYPTFAAQLFNRDSQKTSSSQIVVSGIDVPVIGIVEMGGL